MNKDSSFAPPNLPIKWIAATFIAPALIVILPPLFSDVSMSLETRIIIALALLSILLLIVTFALTVRIYNEAYKTQILSYRLSKVEEASEIIQRKLNLLTAGNQKQD